MLSALYFAYFVASNDPAANCTMAARSPRLAIVGTGLTGSAVFSLLKERIPGIVLWEKVSYCFY
jgi:hypothetical protein